MCLFRLVSIQRRPAVGMGLGDDEGEALESVGASVNTAGPSGTCESAVCCVQDMAASATSTDQLARVTRMILVVPDKFAFLRMERNLAW